jgi:hypothetical protein
MKPSRQYLMSSYTCLKENTLQLYYRDQLINASWGCNKMFTYKLYERHKYKLGKMWNLLLLQNLMHSYSCPLKG